MALVTSQQLENYYQIYKNKEVTFTKDVNNALGLNAKQIFLKCLGEQWPCILYSSSLESAKVILNLDQKSMEKIKKANNLISLRFSFTTQDSVDPMAFFVPGKITGFNPYKKDNPNLMFLAINFTKRPPDNLIEILGTLLETALVSQKRKDERIHFHN